MPHIVTLSLFSAFKALLNIKAHIVDTVSANIGRSERALVVYSVIDIQSYLLYS